eukprot:TRINITY_DN3595_c0_g3_i1.p1 TRINITY_DN3595_c0_g3~~TRINITY_DN3595_c0_g3_i1.p1  ORF type:complete len:504 (-),score=112.97 TRINITY_DN3595_c0_g3_i1:73-1584(-)
MPLSTLETTGLFGGSLLWRELAELASEYVRVQKSSNPLTAAKNGCNYRILTSDGKYVIAKADEEHELKADLERCTDIVKRLKEQNRYSQKALEIEIEEALDCSEVESPLVPDGHPISVITDGDIRNYFAFQEQPALNINSLMSSQNQDEHNRKIAALAQEIFLCEDANQLRQKKAEIAADLRPVLTPVINQRLLELQRIAYEGASLEQLYEAMREIERADDREAQLRKSIFLPIIKDLIISRTRQMYRRSESAKELWAWKVQMLEENNQFEKDMLLAELNENLINRFILWITKETDVNELNKLAQEIKLVQQQLGPKSDKREKMVLALIEMRRRELLEAAQGNKSRSILADLVDSEEELRPRIPFIVRSAELVGAKSPSLVDHLMKQVPQAWMGKTGSYKFDPKNNENRNEIFLEIFNKNDHRERMGSAICVPGDHVHEFKVLHFSINEPYHLSSLVDAVVAWISMFQQIRFADSGLDPFSKLETNLILCLGEACFSSNLIIT